MNDERTSMKLPVTACLFVWGAVIFVPLAFLFFEGIFPTGRFEADGGFFEAMVRSFALSAVIAAAAVLLGWVPGRLLGTSGRGGDALLLLLLMPLVLPRYVLYYCWTLLLSPTTELGRYLAGNPTVARLVATGTSSAVLILWFWPLAALVLSQAWRNIGGAVRDSAALEANGFQTFAKVTLPLLAPSVVFAFVVCFVLSLSDFATFHLAGVETIGAELAVLYERTGSHSAAVRAAWPVTIPAVFCAVLVAAKSRKWGSAAQVSESIGSESQPWRWAVTFALVGVSLVAPVVLLIANVTGTQAFRQFLVLHADELGLSLAVAAVAALITYVIAFGALQVDTLAGAGRILRPVVHVTIFLAMFVPASLVAVSMVRLMAVCGLPGAIRHSWWIVSAGQASRFAGAALILLLLGRSSQRKHLSEMAAVDGASRFQAWRHVHLPQSWRLFVGTFLLIVMFGMTELSATMVLLPAGLPNFAQRLLNQMHYARDQQVIASCLVLICVFAAPAGLFVILMRAVRVNRCVAILLLCWLPLIGAGCDDSSPSGGEAKVVSSFGGIGRGHGRFVYPRAIDIGPGGNIFVIDKSGRIQSFTADGEFRSEFKMPLFEVGKPTGLSFAPDGNLYVADTHYHRVVVFSPEGKQLSEFGQFGEEEGSFIYPTDVAFSGDGRIFVSEYGGNDRISVFSDEGVFQYCFGSAGGGRGELSRPSALCVDKAGGRLYVADACNHRIAVYNFDGGLVEYIGSPGRDQGRLRYPYDLALSANGNLVVCEYGNNRLQLFSPDGRSLGVYGGPGRMLGQLAYPWGLAVDGKMRVFVVDAGNNRIQVWRL